MLIPNTARRIFQSTLPARGATSSSIHPIHSSSYFNPRSPHGERLRFVVKLLRIEMISIHAPRTGSDGLFCPCKVWGKISIHAPRTGSDRHGAVQPAQHCALFQSTLPARGATPRGRSRAAGRHISIHAPRTGSDGVLPLPLPTISISIHAPRTGSDRSPGHSRCSGCHFNPRSPHGERHAQTPGADASKLISIHAPRTGSDLT